MGQGQKVIGQGQMCDMHEGPKGQGQNKGSKQRQVGSHQRQVASFLMFVILCFQV